MEQPQEGEILVSVDTEGNVETPKDREDRKRREREQNESQDAWRDERHNP